MEIKQEYLNNRSNKKTAPLRTFKTILNSKDVDRVKEELASSPSKKARDEVMIRN